MDDVGFSIQPDVVLNVFALSDLDDATPWDWSTQTVYVATVAQSWPFAAGGVNLNPPDTTSSNAPRCSRAR